MNEPISTDAPVKDERKIDLAISNILRLGVILSSLLVAVGGAIMLAQEGHHVFVDGKFDTELRSIPGIIDLVRRGKAEGVIQLGVVVLLATPFMRVAFAALAFLKERDYVYVAIALTVLSGLTYSLFYHSL